eukprot:5909468-Prymnesium_polylepis.1
MIEAQQPRRKAWLSLSREVYPSAQPVSMRRDALVCVSRRGAWRCGGGTADSGGSRTAGEYRRDPRVVRVIGCASSVCACRDRPNGRDNRPPSLFAYIARR